MDNRCICCGAIIPEGRQVCLACEQKEKERNKEPYCKGTGRFGTACKYDSAWFCKHPGCKQPILTSTMFHTYPNGCPEHRNY